MHRQINIIVPDGNRAQRRKAQRQARPLQARARKPKVAGANMVDYVLQRATRLTSEERQRLLSPSHDALKALNTCTATIEHWAALAGMVNTAIAIEAQGVIRGFSEHFAAADCALDAIWHRIQDGTNGVAWGRHEAPYFDEIDALREAVALHNEQLLVLAVSELRQAQDQMRRTARAAGACEISAPANSLPLPIQEILF